MKSDFLRECMSDVGNVPIDEFNKAYCTLCANRDCDRSAANNLLFDRRINNWQEKLFNKIPRADDMDSRYDHIRSKKFLPIQTYDQVPSISSSNIIWDDTTIQNETYSQQPEKVSQNASDNSVAIPLPSDTEKPQEKTSVPVYQEFGNTNFIQGTTIGQSKDKTIEVGGTFVFDDDK